MEQNQKELTIWQRLSKTFGPNSILGMDDPVYKFDKKEIETSSNTGIWTAIDFILSKPKLDLSINQSFNKPYCKTRCKTNTPFFSMSIVSTSTSQKI